MEPRNRRASDRIRLPTGLLVTLLAVGIVSFLSNYLYHQRVLDRFELIDLNTTWERKVLTTTWTSGGLQRQWTTSRKDDEALDALVVRHAAELVVIQDSLPPDPN